MTDTNVAVQLGNNPFTVINGNKPVKFNQDGSVCKIHNNKKKGVSSEVYAFKSMDEIKAMIDELDRKISTAKLDGERQLRERNKLLFLIGINVGIRASDLRLLKWNFFLNEDGTFKNSYTIQPKKTRKFGKFITLYFNNTIKSAILNYVEKYPIENLDDYIFESQRGGEPILERSLWRIVKNTARDAGIEQNIGSHSLRKTWGYWCWHEAEDKAKALVILQSCFNHSNTNTTMKYIGLLDEEVEDMYHSIELGLDFI